MAAVRLGLREKERTRRYAASPSPDGVDTPATASMCDGGSVVVLPREAVHARGYEVGLDLAKMVFQVHGADVSRRATLRTRLRRPKVLSSPLKNSFPAIGET